MLDTLITSKLRVKLLTRFFLNPEVRSWLRGLETEFGVSSNAVRQELNRLEEADIIRSEEEGNRKLFKVNDTHPLFDDVRRIVLKTVGIEQVVENVLRRLGNLKKVYLTGALARGIDAPEVELYIIGDVDRTYLSRLTNKAEKMIGKTIRTAVFTPEEWDPELIEDQTKLNIYDVED